MCVVDGVCMVGRRGGCQCEMMYVYGSEEGKVSLTPSPPPYRTYTILSTHTDTLLVSVCQRVWSGWCMYGREEGRVSVC